MKSLMNKFGRSLAALLAFAMIATTVFSTQTVAAVVEETEDVASEKYGITEPVTLEYLGYGTDGQLLNDYDTDVFTAVSNNIGKNLSNVLTVGTDTYYGKFTSDTDAIVFVLDKRCDVTIDGAANGKNKGFVVTNAAGKKVWEYNYTAGSTKEVQTETLGKGTYTIKRNSNFNIKSVSIEPKASTALSVTAKIVGVAGKTEVDTSSAEFDALSTVADLVEYAATSLSKDKAFVTKVEKTVAESKEEVASTTNLENGAEYTITFSDSINAKYCLDFTGAVEGTSKEIAVTSGGKISDLISTIVAKESDITAEDVFSVREKDDTSLLTSESGMVRGAEYIVTIWNADRNVWDFKNDPGLATGTKYSKSSGQYGTFSVEAIGDSSKFEARLTKRVAINTEVNISIPVKKSGKIDIDIYVSKPEEAKRPTVAIDGVTVAPVAGPVISGDNVTYTISSKYAGTDGKVVVNLSGAGANTGNAYIDKIVLTPDEDKLPEITEYTVSVNAVENGTVSANVVKAKEGEKVTLTVTPADGYVLDTLTVMNGEKPVTVAADNTFTMPAGNVTVSATFKVVDTTSYSVSINAIENGTVTADKAEAKEGEKVTLTVTPAEGYVLDTLTVMNGEKPVTVAADNTFTMPAANVTVSATFKAVETGLKKYDIDTAAGVTSAIPEDAKEVVKYLTGTGAECTATNACSATIGTTNYTQGFKVNAKLFGTNVPGTDANNDNHIKALFDRKGTATVKIWAVTSAGSSGAKQDKTAMVSLGKVVGTTTTILDTSAGLTPNTYKETDKDPETAVLTDPVLTVSDINIEAGDALIIGRGNAETSAIVIRVEIEFNSEAVDEYTVSFNMLGHGDAIASKKVVSGAKVAEPTPAPKATGFTFGGWFKDEACTTPFVFASESITADTTIYAKWTEDGADTEYTVTFDVNGLGTAPTPVKVKKGNKLTAPTVAPVDTYVVEGWYKESTYATKWNFETDTVVEDITIYAKWVDSEADKYKFVELPAEKMAGGVAYGDANVVTFTADEDFEAKADTNAETTGYDKYYQGTTNNVNLKISAKADTTVKVLVRGCFLGSAKTFYVMNGETVVYSEEMSDAKVYEFKIDMKAGANYSVYAKGSKVMVYALAYKQNGAAPTTYDVTVASATNGTVSVDKTKAAAGDVVTVTTTPATGYVLDTLTVMNGTSPVTVTGGKFTMPAGNVTVTATFKAQGATEYTVTVAPATNGTVSVDKTKAAAGEVVTVTTTPAAGYVLDKLTVMNGTSPVTVTGGKFTMPAGNVTVTATFKAEGAPTPAPIPTGIETETEISKDGEFVFTYEAEKTFTGAAIKPFVAVEYDGTTLVPGVDYTAAYKNNTKVYTAKQDDKSFDAKKAPQITITGKGNYVGKEAVLYFTINEVKVEKEGDIVVKPFIEYNSKDAAGNTLDPAATKKGIVFTGDAIDPIESGIITLKSKVKVAGIQTEVTLEPDVDYVYSIANNINVGTANIYVKSMGKYKGEAKLTFKIAKANLSTLVSEDSRVIKDKFTFKAKGNKPVVAIDDLLVGSDYKLTYKNNVKVNTPVKDIDEVVKKYLAGDKDAKKALAAMPTITATGAGNYTGKVEFFFNIDKADIDSDLDVCMTAVKNGAAISTAVPSVFDADGNMLKAKTDFVVDYYVSVNNGEAQFIDPKGKGVNTGIKDAKGKDIVVKVGTKLSTLDPEVFTVTAVVKANTPKTGNATVDGELAAIELVNATEKATLKSALADKKFAATYTGEAIELVAENLNTTITVGKDKPVSLTLGTDYKVVYSNNVNKGTATAYIIPSTDGVTSGEKTIIASGVVKVTFKINPNTIVKPEYK